MLGGVGCVVLALAVAGGMPVARAVTDASIDAGGAVTHSATTTTTATPTALDQRLLAALGERSAKSLEATLSALAAGANAHVLSAEGETTLHVACIYGDAGKVRALLEAGADPNARASRTPSQLDMTPLTWCAYGGYTEAVEAFIAHGGGGGGSRGGGGGGGGATDVNMVVRQEDGAFITAMDIALKIGERGSGAASALEAAGGKTYAQLVAAAEAAGGEVTLPPGGGSA